MTNKIKELAEAYADKNYFSFHDDKRQNQIEDYEAGYYDGVREGWFAAIEDFIAYYETLEPISAMLDYSSSNRMQEFLKRQRGEQ